MTWVCFNSCAWCYQYLKTYVGNLAQMSLQISSFELSSFVLSWFFCVFQKAVLFGTLGNYNIIYAITSGGNYLLIIYYYRDELMIVCFGW
jgi:hypothetical protein